MRRGITFKRDTSSEGKFIRNNTSGGIRLQLLLAVRDSDLGVVGKIGVVARWLSLISAKKEKRGEAQVFQSSLFNIHFETEGKPFD